MPENSNPFRIPTARPDSGEFRVNLAQRRTWYAEGDAGSDGQQNDQQQTDTSKYNPKDLEEANKIIAALVKRVGERDGDAKKWQDAHVALETRIKAMEEANRQKLAKDGNHEELAQKYLTEVEQLRPLSERAKALESMIRTSNETRINSVPEAMRSIIPAEYAPEKLSAWLDANMGLLTKPPAANFNAGEGGGSGRGSGTEQLTAEEKDIAKRTGMTPEQYVKAKAATTPAS